MTWCVVLHIGPCAPLLSVGPAAPVGGVGVLVGYGGHEATLPIHVVIHSHEPLVGQPHVVRPLHAPRVPRRLRLAVVILVLLVIHLPLEVVLPEIKWSKLKGSFLKTGQHFIFVILYSLLLIKYIYLIPYQGYCLNFLCIKAKDLI